MCSQFHIQKYHNSKVKMKTSLLISTLLSIKLNSIGALYQSNNMNVNENFSTDEVFAEREDFWNRELGNSIGKFLLVHINIMDMMILHIEMLT